MNDKYPVVCLSCDQALMIQPSKLFSCTGENKHMIQCPCGARMIGRIVADQMLVSHSSSFKEEAIASKEMERWLR